MLIVLYLGLQNPQRIMSGAKTVAGLISPFLLGVVFAFLLERPYSFFEQKLFGRMAASPKKQVRRLQVPLSVLCTYLSVVVVLVLAGFGIGPQIASGVSQFADRVPGFVVRAQRWLTEISGSGMIPLEFQQSARTWITGQISKILEYIPKVIEATPRVTGAIMAFGGGVFDFFIALVASLYLLLQKNQLLSQLSRLNRAFLPQQAAERLARAGVVTSSTFRSYVNGQLLDAFIVGAVSIIGLSVLRFPYAALVGTVMGVTNVIPFFGPFIGAVPGFIIIATADPIKALWYILFVVVVQQIDGNFIVPRIIGDSIGLPPFWVLVSVTVGGGLFGIWGMVLGMPLFAAAYKLLGEATRQRETQMWTAETQAAGKSPAKEKTSNQKKERKSS